jgi:hypothetical protein
MKEMGGEFEPAIGAEEKVWNCGPTQLTRFFK